MDSTDSLKLDENLARFLAAYDQEIEGGDPSAATVSVPMPVDGPPANERTVTPLHPDAPHEGSRGEVFPDSHPPTQVQSPIMGLTPSPGGPHRIGRFELRRQLGKGGCGIVFLAYDPKLQREVALKIPRPEMLMNPDAKRRLMREALAAAEFDHPNLVPVFEAGEIGPVCYIATAFCPGQTLAEWLDRQAFPVPVRQAARLVATVAEAVQHAHDRGVLHRDLKPNNVILQELQVEENDEPPPGSVLLRGQHLLPRLVDFGLAKLAERGGPSETATRQILGTPKYMAPEQAQARREDIGPPADVYALGVILYEMLTGRAPYDGATDVEVLRQAIEGKPIPPRVLRPDVPRDLEAICLKAMARTTTERYRTAIDFADDLRRFLEGRPTVARPLAWSGRAYRWLRRNDQVVAIAVLAVIAVFVTSLATWNSYRSSQLRKDRDNEQANRNRTEQQREYSRYMQEAHLAWRSGNSAAAVAAIDSARRVAGALMELPDFTLEYLTRLVKTDRLMIVCPAGPVTALAVSQDGTRLASGHADGTIAVWDRATGKQLGAIKAHESEVSHVGFAVDGTLLVTSGKLPDHSSAMLGWHVTKDGDVQPAAGHLRTLGKDVYCFAISPDGQTVYAGGHNGLLLKRGFNEPAPMVARPSTPALAAVVAVTVSHDGKRVITADGRGTVVCWTAGLQPDEVRDYQFGSEVSALAASDAALPSVGFGGGTVWLTAPMCQPLVFSTGGRVHWIATTAAGNVAHNGPAGRIRLGVQNDMLTGDTGEIRAGVFAPDGKTLFTGSQDGVIRSWDIAHDTRHRGATAVGAVTALSVSTTGQYVISDQHHVLRYDGKPDGSFVGDGRRAQVAVRLLDSGVRGVALDGRTVIVTDFSGNTGTERLRVTVPDNRIAISANLNTDGTVVAVGDDAGRVAVWSVTEQKLQALIDTGHRRPVSRVVLSATGDRVLAPTATGIALWTVGTAEPTVTIVADDQVVFSFLPVGERITTAGRDGVVRVWNAGREELTLYGHVGRVTGLTGSPDGRTLVSGSATGEVKFWDLRTGQELLGLRRHSTPVTLLEFASGGRFLVTAGNGQLAVWDARD